MNINDILAATPSDGDPHRENDKKVKAEVQKFFTTRNSIRRVWVFNAKRPITQDRYLWATKDIMDLCTEVMVHPSIRKPIEKVADRITVYAYQLLGDIMDGPYTELSNSIDPDELTAVAFHILHSSRHKSVAVFFNFYFVNIKTNLVREIEINKFELDEYQLSLEDTFIGKNDLKNI